MLQENKEMLSTCGENARRVIIIGAGQAGFQVAASLRENGFSGRIHLIGDEPELPYQRPPLSKSFLLGGRDRASLDLRPIDFYVRHNIAIAIGERVTAIDRAAKTVKLSRGNSIPYDQLVLATGARNRALVSCDAPRETVVQLRTAAEAEYLRARLTDVQRIVLIGAGFIGLELAMAARTRGIAVTVLEAAQRVMARVLSEPMSAFFRRAHEDMGVTFRLGATAHNIRPRSGESALVETTTGEVLLADLVIIGVGIVPNTELALGGGLAVDDGIVVDDHLISSDPAISAIGDCATFPQGFLEGRRGRLESVQNAVDQARCVAARLTGRPRPYRAVPWFWSNQGHLKLQIAGCAATTDDSVVRGAPESGAFSVFRFRGGRLTGVETVNKPSDHMTARKLLTGALSITPAEAADPRFDLRARASALAA